MTDNEIIKALECCSNQMYACTDKQCKAKTLANALDLINRQKAEIDRLRSLVNFVDCTAEANEVKIEGAPKLVIRCKDCENYNTAFCADCTGWCEELCRMMMDDRYCSCGRRSETNAD